MLACSGTATDIRCRQRLSRMSCRISPSKFTLSLPVCGCRMISVACSPALAASIDLQHNAKRRNHQHTVR